MIMSSIRSAIPYKRHQKLGNCLQVGFKPSTAASGNIGHILNMSISSTIISD